MRKLFLLEFPNYDFQDFAEIFGSPFIVGMNHIDTGPVRRILAELLALLVGYVHVRSLL